MEKLELLIRQYAKFDDAIIEKIIYNLHYREPVMEIYIITRNLTNDRYDKVILFLINIEELKFVEPPANYKCVGDCNFFRKEGKYVFDFTPWTDSTTDLEEIRKSKFYAICNDFFFEFEPLPD